MPVESDEADDLLTGGAFHVGDEEVAVESRHGGDTDDDGQDGFRTVRCRDSGVPPYLGVAKEVEKEALHQDERDGGSRCVGMDSVDMRDAEEDVTATSQQEAEDERDTETEVVIGGGEIPEDTVGAGAAQDDHQDARIS